jgi:hypothetical protein
MASQDILMAHHCQAMTHFELGGVKKLSSPHDPKPEPKLTLFAVMTPYLLLPNTFISHMLHPMIVVMASQEILMAYHCQAMTHFELGGVKKLSPS